jgi:hypothetical protein
MPDRDTTVVFALPTGPTTTMSGRLPKRAAALPRASARRVRAAAIVMSISSASDASRGVAFHFDDVQMNMRIVAMSPRNHRAPRSTHS